MQQPVPSLPVAGEGIRAIATAKAGVMKQGRPVLLGPQTEPEAQQVSSRLGSLHLHTGRRLWPALCIISYSQMEQAGTDS